MQKLVFALALLLPCVAQAQVQPLNNPIQGFGSGGGGGGGSTTLQQAYGNGSGGTAGVISLTSTGGVFTLKNVAGSDGLVITNNTAAPAFGQGVDLVDDGGQAVFCTTAYGVNDNPAFLGRQARGTAASPTASQTGDILSQLTAHGYGATGFSSSSRGKFQVLAAEDWTDAAQGSYINIQLTQPGTTTLTTPVSVTYNGVAVSGGTATASFPAFTVAQTWNNAAVQFFGEIINITPTASTGTSLALAVQDAGVTTMGISGNSSYSGQIQFNTNSPNTQIYAIGATLGMRGDSGITLTCGGSTPVNVDSDFLEPLVDASYDLGNATGPLRWRNGLFSGTVTTGSVAVSSAGAVAWNSDMGLSRGAAKVLYVGDGAAGDYTGQIDCSTYVGITATATTGAFIAQVTGDGANRYSVTGQGNTQWGSGSAAFDLNISRDGPGVLDVGTGAQGNKGGTVNATTANFTGVATLGTLEFGTAGTTGSTTNTLGTAGPNSTAAPNTWVAVKLSDGSTGYMPVWK
jgi:hypothetical protein